MSALFVQFQRNPRDKSWRYFWRNCWILGAGYIGALGLLIVFVGVIPSIRHAKPSVPGLYAAEKRARIAAACTAVAGALVTSALHVFVATLGNADRKKVLPESPSGDRFRIQRE